MMKTLDDYINESLLDDEEDLINDTDFIREEAIYKWLKLYCSVNRRDKIELVKDNNDNYIVNADWLSISASAPQIPIDLFTFGTVNNLEIFINLRWTNLKGCPKIVKKECYISGCDKLESLEGGPEEVGNFICTSNKNLKSLKYAPKKIKGNVNISGCESIKTLEGLGEMKKTKELHCGKCKSLLSLKGSPKEVKVLNINECMMLRNLDYMPMADSVVANGILFSKDEILAAQKINKTKTSGKRFTLTYTDFKDRLKTTEMFYR